MLAFPGKDRPETFGLRAGAAVGIAKTAEVLFFDPGKWASS